MALLSVRGESVLQHCSINGWPYKDTHPLFGSFRYLTTLHLSAQKLKAVSKRSDAGAPNDLHQQRRMQRR